MKDNLSKEEQAEIIKEIVEGMTPALRNLLNA